MFTFHNALHNEIGFYIFPICIDVHLAYFEYSLCQIWSVYMQYLRCYDHSNGCLFLVIHQAEVLLNFFFWWVYALLSFPWRLIKASQILAYQFARQCETRETARWVKSSQFIAMTYWGYQRVHPMLKQYMKLFGLWYLFNHLLIFEHLVVCLCALFLHTWTRATTS